jgi:hypothetical protein
MDLYTEIYQNITLPVRECAIQYVNNFPIIDGVDKEKWASYLFEKLIPQDNQTCEFDSPSIVGVGPGSSGTRSLNMMLGMLNITTQHYGQFTFNCSSRICKGCYSTYLHDNILIARLDTPST